VDCIDGVVVVGYGGDVHGLTASGGGATARSVEGALPGG